ncbi:histidine kinase N-terminal 7TM domain-containing protein [uncultured Eubacterium sp.]|uniref:histidine kinase N-terminal 7TM domain-containing protein n=1 Tax=uncultured Eubacterium sp. TaxID=165185 RepID=UPI003454845B
MSVLYGVTCVASIVLLAICSVSYRKENKWLMWLFLSVAVTNIGYFALSVSPNLVLAITSNTVAYLGSVYISVFMFLTIASMCKLKIPNKVVALLLCIGVIVFVIATSAWYSDIYYVDVAIEKVNNATVLVKTYGVLHPIYKVYVILYLVAMIGILVYSFIRKENRSVYVSLYLSFLVAINIGIWLVESILKTRFEFLSVSYVISEILLIMFYSIVKKFIDA